MVTNLNLVQVIYIIHHFFELLLNYLQEHIILKDDDKLINDVPDIKHLF